MCLLAAVSCPSFLPFFPFRSLPGNEPLKEELLAKSLSLVRKNEAVDLTFATENECNKLGDWIDAKWSVAM